MKISIFFLVCGGVALASAADPKMEQMTISLERSSAFGGPASDVRKMAADFLSLPALAEKDYLPEAVLLKKFPVGMKKRELLSALRAVRIQHLCETELSDVPESVANGASVPAMVIFEVKNYVRIRPVFSDPKIPSQESIAVESFSIDFHLSKSGEIIDVLSSQSYREI